MFYKFYLQKGLCFNYVYFRSKSAVIILTLRGWSIQCKMYFPIPFRYLVVVYARVPYKNKFLTPLSHTHNSSRAAWEIRKILRLKLPMHKIKILENISSFLLPFYIIFILCIGSFHVFYAVFSAVGTGDMLFWRKSACTHSDRVTEHLMFIELKYSILHLYNTAVYRRTHIQ